MVPAGALGDSLEGGSDDNSERQPLRRSVAEIVLTDEHWRIHMLWTIFVVLMILWLLGFSLHVGGGLIHLLLVIGLVILVFNLVSGRRTV